MIFRKIEKYDNLPLANVIRTVFEEHEAPQKGTVYSDPTTDDLYRLFGAEKSVLWVAVVEQEIVGCCGIYPTDGLPENCAELVKFYLSVHARGKGIGKTLMEKSIESAKEFGYKRLYLESLSQFSNAVRIYEKQGFVRIDKPLGKSGHITCNIWMIKELE
ncbi:N-acetyltransferase [Bacteroidia bacterium]|nr:N-acetyltransferase [Bacteroidia bacterium]GHT61575.1 N-acetyltransferase [Bacteroidia bacterium]